MEGKIGKRRSLPPVVRSFVPTRLSPDLLASAYARLFGRDQGADPAPGDLKEAKPLFVPLEYEALTTGGRS